MFLKPGKIQLHILSPISTDGHTVESLKQLSFDKMAAYYTANNPT
jgi:hypothetical protein